MIYLAIDPGSSGGFAFHNTIDNSYGCFKCPATDTEIVDSLKKISSIANGEVVHVMAEKVGGFIGLRKKIVNIYCPYCKGLVPYEISEGDPGSTMFKFGDGNGFVRGVCIALGFGYDTIAPRSWQKVHNLFKARGMGKTAWKNILKDRAQKLFPQLKVTLPTADALLILDVMMRMRGGVKSI